MYDLKFKDGDYVPKTRALTKDMKADDTALIGSFKGGATTAISKHLKQKYNTSQEAYDLTTGAYEKLLGYVSSMEHAKHFLPVAESAKNLLNKSTKPLLIEKLGKKRVSDLEYHLNDIITDGASAHSSVLDNKAIRTVLKYNVVTTLAMKLGSIPKQLTSATHWLGAGLEDGVSTTAIAMQVWKVVPTMMGGAKTISKIAPGAISESDSDVINAIFNSSFVRERSSGRDIDFETRKLFDQMSDRKGRALQDNLVRLVMSPTVIGDMGGVLVGGIPFALATYNNNVKSVEDGGKGMSHEDAVSDAVEKFVYNGNKTQQSVRRDIISNAQKDPTYRLFLTYKTSQVAAMAQMVKGMKVLTDTKGEYTARERAQALRKITYYAVSNSLFQLVAGGTLGMMYADDDDDDQRASERNTTAWYNLIMDTISSNVQGFGFGGMIADFGLNSLRDRDVFNNIPIKAMILDVVEGGKNLIQHVADDDGEDVTEHEWAVWQKLAGIKNVMKQIKSWEQFGEGDINFWDAWMGRSIDEETGHMYVTGDERGDWLYNKILGEEEAKAAAPKSTGRGKKTPTDVLNKRMSGTSNQRFKSTSSTESTPAKRTSTKPIQIGASTASPKQKTYGDMTESEKRLDWFPDYKNKFGVDPTDDMDLNDIIKAMRDSENKQQ
jgi:hypothetical protein